MADRMADTRQGRDCKASLNATRAVFGLKPVEGVCTTCEKVGACIVPTACERPATELQPIRRRIFTSRKPRLVLPSTREEWGTAVQVGMGLAGFVLLAWLSAGSGGWW